MSKAQQRGPWKVMRYSYLTGDRLEDTYHHWAWSAHLAAWLEAPFCVGVVIKA